MLRWMKSFPPRFRCCSRSTSNERSHPILAVPADAGAIEFAEQRFEARADFDEFDIPRQEGGGVHVRDAAARRDPRQKSEIMSGGLIPGHVLMEIPCGPASKVKALCI